MRDREQITAELTRLKQLIQESLLVIREQKYKGSIKFDEISNILDQGFFSNAVNVGLIDQRGKLILSADYNQDDVILIKSWVRVIAQYLLPMSIYLDIAENKPFSKLLANDRMNRAFKAAVSIVRKDDKSYLPFLEIINKLTNICINQTDNQAHSQDNFSLFQWLQIAINQIDLNSFEIDGLNTRLDKSKKDLEEMTFKYNSVKEQNNKEETKPAQADNIPSKNIYKKMNSSL